MSSDCEEVQVKLLERVSEIDELDWNAMLGDDMSPFLEWRFLTTLEESGTLTPESGWIPRIPVVTRGSRVIAAVPVYIKLNSFGEFVFDHSWAHFADSHGVPYYPKILVGVPFTPVSGRRFLTAEDENRTSLLTALGQVIIEICRTFSASSVHVNFATKEETDVLESLGFSLRLGIQYHWYRNNDTSFNDYLGRFNSKRRNQLKRERRAPTDEGIIIENLRGDELIGQADLAYRLYLSTVEKFIWGRKYLNKDVFVRWVEHFRHRMELMVARKSDGTVVAGAVNFSKGERLFGRYWGCFEEIKHLHFNVCYYRGIEECFDRGIDIFEPGAGGEHKLVRGFAPTLTRSVHWMRLKQFHSAIEQYLDHERQQVLFELESLQEEMGCKKPKK